MITVKRRSPCAISQVLLLGLMLYGIIPIHPSMAFQSNLLSTAPRKWAPTAQTISTIYPSSPLTAPTSTSIRGFFDEGDELVGQDRIKACIPYVLPLLDGDAFGAYIYDRIPPLKFLHELLLAPLVSIFDNIPFLAIILFIILSIGTRNTDGMTRMVRFNAQQAVLIDVVLIVPTWMASVMERTGGVPRVWDEAGCNFVYYALMSAILYSIFSNLNGKKPDGIPYLSGAAEFMVGPF